MVAVYLRILELACILSKSLLALFAYEGHVEGLQEGVVLLLGMALSAIKPLLAWALVSTVLGAQMRSRAQVNAQHGERMATWALRTCLLHGASARRGGTSSGRRKAYHMAAAAAAAAAGGGAGGTGGLQYGSVRY